MFLQYCTRRKYRFDCEISHCLHVCYYCVHQHLHLTLQTYAFALLSVTCVTVHILVAMSAPASEYDFACVFVCRISLAASMCRCVHVLAMRGWVAYVQVQLGLATCVPTNYCHCYDCALLNVYHTFCVCLMF